MGPLSLRFREQEGSFLERQILRHIHTTPGGVDVPAGLRAGQPLGVAGVVASTAGL